MDGGAWQATVHDHKELDTTEQLTLFSFHYLKSKLGHLTVAENFRETKQKMMCLTVELFSMMCLPHC